MNEGLFSAYESRDEWKTLVERLGRADPVLAWEAVSPGRCGFVGRAGRDFFRSGPP